MAWVRVRPVNTALQTEEDTLLPRSGKYGPCAPPDAVPAVIDLVQEVAVFDEPAPLLDSQLGWWDLFWRDRARNKLQRNLARIIQICQDHESNGVSSGDPIYQHLYNKGLELCHGHFDEWHLNRDNIEIEIPCMRQLRLSAYPAATISARKAPVAFLGLVAIVALPLIVGAWTGLFGVGQRWIVRLFGG